MKKQKEMVKIGHLDVPIDYFTLPVDEKEVICNIGKYVIST